MVKKIKFSNLKNEELLKQFTIQIHPWWREIPDEITQDFLELEQEILLRMKKE